ncbi:MAG: hypothetical protein GX193_02715, partial [Clostridiales bacterium]|nr:hypothetical protein [Clostridiales bacterium]
IAATCTVLWAMYRYDGIYPNVTVYGVNIGGLSKQEAAPVTESVLATYANEKIEVSFEDRIWAIPLMKPESIPDAEEVLHQAMSVGRTGSFIERFKVIAGSLFETHELLSQTRTDRADIEEFLRYFESVIEKDKNNPKYEVTDDELIIEFGNMGMQLDISSAAAAIEKQINDRSFEPVSLEKYIEYDEVEDINLLDIYNEILVEPADAYLDLSGEEPRIVPHVTGLRFDLAEAGRMVSQAKGNTERAVIPLIKTDPEITTGKFEELLFRDVLSEAKTTLNASNINRTGNVRLSANAINGYIMNPGDVFSYNQVVGPRTYENGYRDASVYTSEGIEDQLGGGICQTSSTLYMNVIRAGLEIVERQNHAYTVVYSPLGEDATVYWGSLDFRFSNNQKFPIKIEAYQKDDYVYVRILGTKLDNNTVKIETKVLAHTPYETITVENPNLDYGVRRQKREGHSYYKVETYRVVYDENGKEISREKLPNSTYKRLDRIMEVGTKGAPTVSPIETPAPGTPIPTETPKPSPTPTPTAPPTGSPQSPDPGTSEEPIPAGPNTSPPESPEPGQGTDDQPHSPAPTE